MQDKWVIEYVGYCCDSGQFYRAIEFNSKKTAYAYYNAWKKCKERGQFWSDGPDHMREPALYQGEWVS
jgi:hypothetical protein